MSRGVGVWLALALASVGCGDGSGSRDGGPDARIVLDAGPDAGASDAGDGAVPDAGPSGDAGAPWIGSLRIHAHTRLWRVLEGTPEFSFAASGFEELGAPVFSRHVKTGEEDPWWPSAVPTADGAPVLAGADDLVTPMVEGADAAGVRIVAYYWHASDATVADMHPEWVCHTLAGEPAESGRGTHLDPTTGYGDILRTRFVELAERGFDGVYLDPPHLPTEGCFGTPLADRFRADTGMEPPASDTDASYAPYLAYSAARVAEALAGWRDAVRAVRPDFAVIATASDLPALTLPHARAAPMRHVDAAKTELHLALDPDASASVFDDPTLAVPPDDVRMALGFALLRDAAGGRPPHVWAPGLPDADHARGFVASVTAWGGIANLDVADSLVLTDGSAPSYKTTRPVLREALAFGVRISEVLGETRPLRFAAVHFPETARDARTDPVTAWREVLWPFTAAFEALLRARVPAGIVDDAHLATGALDGYSLLIVPSPDDLTDTQRAAVDTFRDAGGTVIEVDGAAAFDDPAASDTARTALAESLSDALAAAPLRVAGGPAHLHAIAPRRSRKRTRVRSLEVTQAMKRV